MKLKTVLAVAIAMSVFSGVASSSENQVVTVSKASSMVATSDFMKMRLSDCQPLVGEKVEILEVKHDFAGLPGVAAARVKVLSGECAGREGWFATDKLNFS